MNPCILEGGGLLGGYSFDKIEAEPEPILRLKSMAMALLPCCGFSAPAKSICAHRTMRLGGDGSSRPFTRRAAFSPAIYPGLLPASSAI